MNILVIVVVGRVSQVSISKGWLTAGVKGVEPVLYGETFASVKPDDSYWNVSDGKVLEITLQKASDSCQLCPAHASTGLLSQKQDCLHVCVEPPGSHVQPSTLY